MKHEESTIVTYGTSIDESVDFRQLYLRTRKNHLSSIYFVAWHTIQELHILNYSKSDIGNSSNRSSFPNEGCYVDDSNTWALIIGAAKSDIEYVISRCGSKLKTLDIRFCELPTLDVANLKGLEKLCVSFTQCPINLTGLEELFQLTELDLSFTSLKEPPTLVHQAQTLWRLDLSGNPDLVIKNCISILTELQDLDLSGTKIGPDLDISNQKKLKRLRLVDTPNLGMLRGLEKNTEIEYLDLSCSAIKSIPDEICELRKLIHLDLSNLKLDSFPSSLMQLDMEFSYCDDGINLRNTVIPGVDMDLFNQCQTGMLSREQIKKWHEDFTTQTDRPLKEVKVVFLGNGQTGKTRTISRLINDGGEPRGYIDIETPGVTVSSKRYLIDGSRINVHFWDFGGQPEILPVHYPFLQKDALYVVMLNAATYPEDQARYWLNTIDIFAKDSPVLVVLNKVDLVNKASINETALMQEYSNIEYFVKMSAATDSKESLQDGLIQRIKTVLSKMAIVKTAFPPSWHLLRDMLRNFDVAQITYEAFCNLAKECGVNETDYERVLALFNQTGISYTCLGSPSLRRYVILNPNWLTNALYTIAFNMNVLHRREDKAKFGIIPHDDLRWILDPTETVGNNIKRILENARYNDDQFLYVLELLRHQKLSVRIDSSSELIPMLCGRVMPLAVREYEDHPDTIVYILEYQSLMNSVIHQLMNKMHSELDSTFSWNSGAKFNCSSNDSSVIVRKEENRLLIFAIEKYSKNFETRYGKFILMELKSICDSLGLKLVKECVRSKVCSINPNDGGARQNIAEVEIDLEEYENRFATGTATIYSKALQGVGRIMDLWFIS